MQKTGGLGFNFHQTKTFLNAAFPTRPRESFFELRLLNNKEEPRAKQLWLGQGTRIDWPEVERLNGEGWNVYFGLALRKEQKGTRNAVTQVCALGVDLDVRGPLHPKATFTNKRAAFLAFVGRLPSKLFPSAIQDTGHGLQAFWFLQHPLAVENGTGARVERILRRLASVLDADPRFALNAVFRLPGSWNMKDPTKPRPVRLIHHAPKHRFTLEDFETFVGDAGGGARDHAKTEGCEPGWVTELLRGVPQGHRHDAAKRLAGHLMARGESPEATIEILRAWALRCDPPWTEPGEDKELGEIVGWVAKEEEKRRRQAPPPPETDDETIRQYIDWIRSDTHLKSFLRKRTIAEVITDQLRARGRFLDTPEGPMYFRRDRLRVVELVSGGSGLGGVLERFGLNPTETEAKYVLEHLRTEVVERGERCEVRRLAHYNTASGLLYLSQFNGRVLRLDGEMVATTENGEDGIYFCDDPAWKPWEPDLEAPRGVLQELLVDPLHFVGAHVAVEDIRRIWFLWIQTIFFAEWMRTKPLALLVGPKGAGKTSAFRALLVALLGPNADVVALEGGQRGEEAFIAAVTGNRLVAFDNADAKISWLEDHLARVSTGSDIARRQLYTTNTLVSYRPQVFVGLTARTPRFRREDVAERTLVLPMGELEQKMPERILIEKVLNRRSALWGEMVRDLNNIVQRLKVPRPAVATSFRIADFAEFGRRVANSQTDWELTLRALRRMEIQQADFALSEDPLFAALEAWVQKNPGRGFIDATTLNKQLRLLAEGEAEKWPYGTGQQLGTRLRDVSGALSKFFRVDRQEEKGKKRWLWSFAPLPRAE